MPNMRFVSKETGDPTWCFSFKLLSDKYNISLIQELNPITIGVAKSICLNISQVMLIRIRR